MAATLPGPHQHSLLLGGLSASPFEALYTYPLLLDQSCYLHLLDLGMGKRASLAKVHMLHRVTSTTLDKSPSAID